MNTKKILSLFLAIASASVCGAQNKLQLELTGGSKMFGYISSQRPGENFTFATDSAVIILPKSAYSTIDSKKVPLSSLKTEWKSWAEENGAVMDRGNDASIMLANIRLTDGNIVTNVRVLQEGVVLRYLDLNPNTYTLPWDTIDVIRAEKRPKLLLSGINRRYKLKSGMEYEGQYVEEKPGETLSLLQDDGVVKVFDRSEVLKDNRVKVNPNQSLFEQSDLIDIVKLTNGTTKRGVIFERNYSESDSITNDYLLIETKSGEIESVSLTDVVEYCKEINEDYKPIYEIDLKANELAVNGVVASFVKLQSNSGILTFKMDQKDIKPCKLTATPTNTQLLKIDSSIDATTLQQFKVLKAQTYKNKKTKEIHYGFSYEDIVKSNILPKNTEVSVNKITHAEYELTAKKGEVFCIYNPIDSSVVVITID